MLAWELGAVDLYGDKYSLDQRPQTCLRWFIRFAFPMWPCAGPQIGHMRHCLREITHQQWNLSVRQ